MAINTLRAAEQIMVAEGLDEGPVKLVPIYGTDQRDVLYVRVRDEYNEYEEEAMVRARRIASALSPHPRFDTSCNVVGCQIIGEHDHSIGGPVSAFADAFAGAPGGGKSTPLFKREEMVAA